jgi:hypothetical protein
MRNLETIRLTEHPAPRSVVITKDPDVRANIVALESAMRAYNTEHGLSDPDCPLIHAFAPGAYGRQIFIPKDTLVVGKIHKHAHLNFLMKGKVSVATEEGPMLLEGPLMMVSKAGTKRVVYTHEDTTWATVHLTDSQDLEQIEEEIIAKSYDELDLLLDADVQQLLPLIQKTEEDAL